MEAREQGWIEDGAVGKWHGMAGQKRERTGVIGGTIAAGPGWPRAWCVRALVVRPRVVARRAQCGAAARLACCQCGQCSAGRVVESSGLRSCGAKEGRDLSGGRGALGWSWGVAVVCQHSHPRRVECRTRASHMYDLRYGHGLTRFPARWASPGWS